MFACKFNRAFRSDDKFSVLYMKKIKNKLETKDYTEPN